MTAIIRLPCFVSLIGFGVNAVSAPVLGIGSTNGTEGISGVATITNVLQFDPNPIVFDQSARTDNLVALLAAAEFPK